MTLPLVACLLAPCCPSAIRRFIVAVRVYTVNAVSFAWLTSHVLQKQLKAILPSVAHCNTSSSVVAKLGVVGIAAPSSDSTPAIVLNRALFSSRVSVGKHAFCRYFGSKTPATTSNPTFQGRRNNIGFDAAFALTFPVCLFVLDSDLSDYGQSPKNKSIQHRSVFASASIFAFTPAANNELSDEVRGQRNEVSTARAFAIPSKSANRIPFGNANNSGLAKLHSGQVFHLRHLWFSSALDISNPPYRKAKSDTSQGGKCV